MYDIFDDESFCHEELFTNDLVEHIKSIETLSVPDPLAEFDIVLSTPSRHHHDLYNEYFVDDDITQESSDYSCYDFTSDDPCDDTSADKICCDEEIDDSTTIFPPDFVIGIHQLLCDYCPESYDLPFYHIYEDDSFDDDLNTHSAEQPDYLFENACVEAELQFSYIQIQEAEFQSIFDHVEAVVQEQRVPFDRTPFNLAVFTFSDLVLYPQHNDNLLIKALSRCSLINFSALVIRFEMLWSLIQYRRVLLISHLSRYLRMRSSS